MTRALWKNALREIWNTKARFLSIFAIIALGVGFFAGVKGASPVMVATAEGYYIDNNLMDIRLISSVGFDDNDVKEIEKIQGITAVNAGYMADVIIDSDDGADVFRVHSLPLGDDPINKLNVVQGRLPEKPGEIVIEEMQSISVGDKLTVQKDTDGTDTSTMIKTLEFTVVGFVQSPMYVSFERGNTNVGSGKISCFAYILPEDFAYERYTEIYAKTDSLRDGASPLDDEYKNSVNKIAEKLKTLGADRIEVFDKETLAPAREKLEDGVKEYEENKRLAEEKLNEAQQQLEQGKKEYKEKIEEAQKQLDKAQEEIEQGESLLPYSMTTYYEEILLAQQKISDGEIQLALAKSQLQSAQSQYDVSIAQAELQLNTAQSEYDTQYYEFYTYTKPQAERKIELYDGLITKAYDRINDIEEKLTDDSQASEYLKKQLEQAKASLEEYSKELESSRQQLKEGEEKLNQAQQQLQQGKDELEKQKTEGQSQLDAAQEQIDNAQAELDNGKREFEEAKKNGRQQITEAQLALSQGKLQLKEGKIQLEDNKTEGQNKITDGEQELEEQRNKAKEELNKAKDKLNDAQKQLDKLSSPEWNVYTRDDISGYVSFFDDTERIDSIAMVFPLFFLLVAVLVCLTTMTRLLEERRTEIGTLKALGYSSASITAKYLLYAVSAGLLGSIAGVAVGVPILPQIILNAYKLMYTLPETVFVVPWLFIIMGTFAAVICTVGVVLFVCRKSLRSYPAKLMRPKAPKPGKRILLERIHFIWSHLGFTSKVTARNLFRYKARMLMTVLGVAGCTALIVAAFGLKDAISDVADVQFTEVFKYDGIIIPQNPGNSTEMEKLCDYVSEQDGIENVVKFCSSLSEVKDNSGNKYDIYVYVPENVSSMKNIVDLHSRTSKESIALDNSGAVISEKIAKIMNIKTGDNIEYTDNGKTYSVPVTGICENYIDNYIFMTPDYYEKIYGREPQFNLIMESSNDMSNDEEDALAEQLLERDDVLTVSFIGVSIDSFKDMIESLNIIVYVMIFCAGALAFVVLYNLTNINIAERTREIATIKVLGFYNREVCGYVYRENIVLTVMGIAAGLVLGVFLSGFIVQTAEIDKFMFGREIHFLSFLYAIGLTALFSLLVNGFMYFKMKVISMVDSLKSIE